MENLVCQINSVTKYPFLSFVAYVEIYALFGGGANVPKICVRGTKFDCEDWVAMCASGQITSNFLTQASWRFYEIRQPPTSLCTTSNFLMFAMVIMVAMVMVVMVVMLVLVVIVVMLVRTGQD